MTDLQDVYFDWMVEKVCPNYQINPTLYINLLKTLNEIDFRYSLPMDANREDDGFQLRYRFGYERNIPDSIIASKIDIRPCSVLEMMIALALRCEEQIMDDPDIGNRMGEWFWEMIDSLGLTAEKDYLFNQSRVKRKVRKFLDRKYNRNGHGGLFTVNDDRYDMREAEIWYQMMWHLHEKNV